MARGEKSGEPLSERNFRALGEFRHQIRRFVAERAHAARAAGIDPQQYQVLLILKAWNKDEPPSIGAIADSMLLRHHTVVELLDRMAAKRFIRRQRSRSDRRVVSIAIQPRGEAILKTLAISNRQELAGSLRELLQALESALAS